MGGHTHKQWVAPCTHTMGGHTYIMGGHTSLCRAAEACRTCVHEQQKFVPTTVQTCKICYWRRRDSFPLPLHPKGWKPAHQLLPIWEGERLLEPCSFPESSKISHLHPDSLVTHDCVCGNSLGIHSPPQSLVPSLAPH